MEINAVKVKPGTNLDQEYKHYLARELCSYRQQIRKVNPEGAGIILKAINVLGYNVNDIAPGIIRFGYFEKD